MSYKLFVLVPVLVLVISFLYSFLFTEKCHIFDPAVTSYFGTKAPYRHVANFNANPLNYTDCHPVKIWSIVRHGTRTPKTKIIKVMRERLNILKSIIIGNIDIRKGNLCPSMKELFKSWKLSIHDDMSQFLTQEGEEEMYLLGQRMRSRFPQILSDEYSNETYKFRYTATQRTLKSADNFVAGLFGKQVRTNVWYPEALHRDPILRFYKLCNKWRKTVAKNPDTFEEQNKFAESEEMIKTVKSVTDRLGIDQLLSVDDVHLMFHMCCFDTAWDSSVVSPWCNIFTPEEMQVLEYYEDLKYYWRDGYGYALNYEQACPAFNDVLKLFVSDSDEPKGVFYFTHSGTLLKMLSFLNLYRDNEILLSTNYKNQSSRKWKVSQIDAFGTNLAFILHKCGDGSDKILTLHQERPVRLPGCPKECDLCPLNDIMNIFKKSINCNFNEMCDNNINS